MRALHQLNSYFIFLVCHARALYIVQYLFCMSWNILQITLRTIHNNNNNNMYLHSLETMTLKVVLTVMFANWMYRKWLLWIWLGSIEYLHFLLYVLNFWKAIACYWLKSACSFTKALKLKPRINLKKWTTGTLYTLEFFGWKPVGRNSNWFKWLKNFKLWDKKHCQLSKLTARNKCSAP